METIGRTLKPDRAPAPKSTRDTAIDAIRRETGASQTRAKAFLAWIEQTVQKLRARGTDTHHDILVAIAPDGAVAQPGSAHHAVEAHVLDPKRGELGLLHDQMYDHGTHCTVQMRMSIVGE
jgi:hypothetical protein